MNNRNIFFIGTGLFILLLYSGCGGQKLPSDLPRLYPTIITVVQGGNPLPDVLVTLVNADSSVSWSCVARTDASGRATMMTNGMYTGAPAGTYKAVVVKQEIDRSRQQDPYANAPDPEVDMMAYQEWYMRNEGRITASGGREPTVYTLINPQFASPDTTTLEVTITTGRNNHTLDVGPAIREVYRERPR